MKRLLYIIIVFVLATVGYYFWEANRTYVILSDDRDNTTLNADLYPLYSGATWGGVEATSSPERGLVSIVRSVPFADTMDIAAVSLPFTKYYDEKLSAAGWTEDMMEAASGPGANISVYRKDGQFIAVSFQSVFKVRKPDAPVECPCDVQLTLLSGTQATPSPAGI